MTSITQADVYGKSRHECSKRNSKGQCKLQKQQAKKTATKAKEDEEFKHLKLKYEESAEKLE